MKLRTSILSLSLAVAIGASAGDCYSILSGDTLKMGNSLIERVYLWNNGHLITCRVTDKASGKTLVSSGKTPDFTVNRAVPSDGRLSVAELKSDGIRPARLVATVSYRLGDLDVERSYRLYDGVPA
ncbi:MAG: alpha-galactosidase, partial [Muribaculaceae bacterium]|nr:alpha-galactosidase [Muribaculaceae bacterium]